MQTTINQPIDKFIKKINFSHIIMAFILILTIATRLVGLGDRVMSHDEVNHVVPSFDLYSGRGYRHDPVTHGPLQFHLIALSYFLFGDNDFSSRLPHALFSILTVGFVMVFFQRYLGKMGAIATGFFFAISPFMMFYGRYARNESLCTFFSVLGLFAILRFLESRESKWLYLLAVSLSLNFSSKETAYIFTAQLLVFLLILSLQDIFRYSWSNKQIKFHWIFFNLGIIVLTAGGVVVSILLAKKVNSDIKNGVISLSLFQSFGNIGLESFIEGIKIIIRVAFPVILPLLITLAILYLCRNLLNWQLLSFSKHFQLLLLVGSLVLPLLAPFPVIFAGIDPTEYSSAYPVLLDYIYLVYLFTLSTIIGFLADAEHWWKYALVFFGIYVVLYTTSFTNTVGLMTGLIGSLGHWLAQQEVGRGGQPFYYFFLILIPMYEFLGAFGTIGAFVYGVKNKSFWMHTTETNKEIPNRNEGSSGKNLIPVPAIFLYFSITTVIAYSLAGEKMPWLTVHIAYSLLLGAGWFINEILMKYLDVDKHNKNKIVSIARTIVFIILVISLLLIILGNHPPFQGKTKQQLQDTNQFLFLFFLSLWLGYSVYKDYYPREIKRLAYITMIIIFAILSLFSFRSAYRASFINYNYPLEFLVYAHAADGPKIVLDQIENISRRMTQGLNIKVAYDNHALYPYWWYLRNYPNKIVYLENPTRTLEEAPLIIAGYDKYRKIEAIIRDNYYYTEYYRLWWPMQDYWNLNWDRISTALKNPEMRQALFNIWLNRDFSLYAQVTGNQNLTLENWLPSEKMRFYIRKDITAQMWDFPVFGDFTQIKQDEYSQKIISRQPDFFIASSGSAAGQLDAPRGIDISPDGTIFIADTGNNRIQQFSKTGELLNTWGSYASILEGEAPGGTFSQPWDVAVGKDGSVYVADTFNHRIQKFNSIGRFIKSWGVFAQGDRPETIWGPRGIAISPEGNVLVTDTGNKRVVVFDKDLNYLTQFGGAGFEPGQFDEPVGIAIDDLGKVYIADTWNRRVQVFFPDGTGINYVQTHEFEVKAWYGQSLENKPFIAISSSGTILITDPEAGRILEFSESGEFIKGWQDLSITSELISQPYDLDFDENGDLWVVDGMMDVVMQFKNME